MSNNNDFKDPRFKELYELQMQVEAFKTVYEQIKALSDILWTEGHRYIELPDDCITPKLGQRYLVIHNQFESDSAVAFAPKFRLKFQKSKPTKGDE